MHCLDRVQLALLLALRSTLDCSAFGVVELVREPVGFVRALQHAAEAICLALHPLRIARQPDLLERARRLGLGVSTVILRLLNRVNVSVLDLGGWLGKSRTVLLLTLIDDGPIRL